MAIRLQGGVNSNKYNDSGDVYTINVHDADYSGSIVPFVEGEDGFTLRYDADDSDRYAAIIASSVRVTMEINSAALQSFVNDLVSAPEQRFSLEILKNGSLWWVGYILTDLVVEEDMFFPYRFQIQATDGIGKLKDVTYDGFVPEDEYSVKETVKDHLLNITEKIGVNPFLQHL